MAKLIFGCGYLGQRVAALWQAAGEEVFALTRSVERAQTLASAGLLPLVADLTAATELPIPQGVRTVLFAVGFDRASGRSIHEVYVGGLARALASLPASVEQLIYISSTGVYGHVTGSEVDESSPCHPMREGGQACLAAEQLLAAGPFADRAIVLRLAGIYGPGRIPRSRDLLDGRPIDAPEQGWLNLIHVEDAARIVLLAEKRPMGNALRGDPAAGSDAATDKASRLYIVSDGQPVQRGDYYRELARLLGAPPPRFALPQEGSPAAERAASDKRVNPRRLMAELSPVLLYSSYREGLAAIVGQAQS